MAKKVKNTDINTEEFTQSADGSAVNAPLLNVVTPMGLDFKKNTFSIGENIARCYGITHYPGMVDEGWLSKITGLPDTIVSLTFDPVDAAVLVNALSRQISRKRSDAATSKDELVRQRALLAAEDAEKTMYAIDREKQAVGQVTASVIALGKEEKEFMRQCRRVEAGVAISKCKMRALPNLQKESFAHASPAYPQHPKIRDILKRIMPLSTFMGGFPFASTGFNDESGYLFAKDSAGCPVILDIWKRGADRTNGNLVVMGIPGVGKSTTVKMMIINEFMNGTKVIMIDPQGEYKELTQNLGGDWMNLSGGGKRINPLQVRPAPEDGDGTEHLNELAQHLKNLEIFFKLYIPSLTDIQSALLKDALIKIYESLGITFETGCGDKTPDAFPTLSDLYEFIITLSSSNALDKDEIKEYKTLALLLKDAAMGADSFIWNGHTTVASNNDCICLDTSALNQIGDNIKSTQYFNILTYAWERMSADRTSRCLLICDEAYLMIDERVPQSLVYMRNFAKQARKYEASVAIISHSLSDFLSPAIRQYGEALLDLPAYRVLMGTDGRNLDETAEIYKLTEAEQELLLAKRRGQALLIAGNKRLKVHFDIPRWKLDAMGDAGGR